MGTEVFSKNLRPKLILEVSFGLKTVDRKIRLSYDKIIILRNSPIGFFLNQFLFILADSADYHIGNVSEK